MTHQIAPVAAQQLQQWQDYAMTEPMQVIIRDGEVHRICMRCDQSIIRHTDGLNAYILNMVTELTMLVAHLRQAHPELEAEVYGE